MGRDTGDASSRRVRPQETLARFSGVQSHNAIRKGLVALAEVGFLILPARAASASPDRQTATYVVAPNSQELWELAQTTARQTQQEIAAEVELRRRQRNERLRSSKGTNRQQAATSAAVLSMNLYSPNTVERQDGIPGIA
jgi:hypothetical protein